MKLKDYVALHGGIRGFQYFRKLSFNNETVSTTYDLDYDELYEKYKDHELIKVKYECHFPYDDHIQVKFTLKP